MTINFLENAEQQSYEVALIPDNTIVDCVIEIRRDPVTNSVITNSKSSDSQYLNLRLEILDKNMARTGICVYHLIGIKGKSEKINANGGNDGFSFRGKKDIKQILCYNWDMPQDTKKMNAEQRQRLENVSGYEVLGGMVCKVLIGIKEDEKYGDKNVVERFLIDKSIKSDFHYKPVTKNNTTNDDIEIEDNIPF